MLSLLKSEIVTQELDFILIFLRITLQTKKNRHKVCYFKSLLIFLVPKKAFKRSFKCYSKEFEKEV